MMNLSAAGSSHRCLVCFRLYLTFYFQILINFKFSSFLTVIRKESRSSRWTELFRSCLRICDVQHFLKLSVVFQICFLPVVWWDVAVCNASLAAQLRLNSCMRRSNLIIKTEIFFFFANHLPEATKRKHLRGVTTPPVFSRGVKFPFALNLHANDDCET